MSVKDEFFGRFIDWLLNEKELTEDDVLNLNEDSLRDYYIDFVDSKIHLVSDN